MRNTTHLSRRLLALAWLVLGAATASAQTVVSWNLEWYPGRRPDQPDPAVVSQQVADARTTLLALDPDIFIGIEMRDREVFDNLVSAVPGMNVAVVTAFRDDDGSIDRQQIGIASRYPIHTGWAEPWIPTMARLPRGFAVAAVREPKTGKLIVVYGVHFKSNRAQGDREARLNIGMRNESALQLVDDYEELRRLVFRDEDVRGWVVAGDFNTNHDGQFDDDVLRTFQRSGFHNTWQGVPAEQRKTWRGDEFYPGTTFDYILTKNLGSPVARLGNAPATTSDHLPVVVRLSSPAD